MRFIFSLILAVIATPSFGESAKKQVAPAGDPKSTKTKVLESGATVLQKDAPADELNIYLVGFHPMKDHPDQQMEAHHFCRQVNEDLAQCALFDGNAKDANLNGIEYIISETMFNTLPEDEKKFWHPHNYEILSGQLVAPGLPDIAEKELMKSKMNSYGKTWHVWNTGHHGMNDGTKIPMGEPMLAWSFNKDNEAKPELLTTMEKKLDINISDTRKKRKDLLPLAKPQYGVNAIADKFKDTKSIQEVVNSTEEKKTIP